MCPVMVRGLLPGDGQQHAINGSQHRDPLLRVRKELSDAPCRRPFGRHFVISLGSPDLLSVPSGKLEKCCITCKEEAQHHRRNHLANRLSSFLRGLLPSLFLFISRIKLAQTESHPQLSPPQLLRIRSRIILVPCRNQACPASKTCRRRKS